MLKCIKHIFSFKKVEWNFKISLKILLIGILFRNKRLMLDEMLQQNTSKFAIFLEYENPYSFFHFSFCTTLFFSLMNAGCTKWKTKKKIWVCVFQKYGKFWSILVGHFIKHKPLISEECRCRTMGGNIDLFGLRKERRSLYEIGLGLLGWIKKL